jgi:hypothetical protein
VHLREQGRVCIRGGGVRTRPAESNRLRPSQATNLGVNVGVSTRRFPSHRNTPEAKRFV